MPDWSDKSILIADDDPSCQAILKQVLKSTGIKVYQCHNGQQAFDECIKNTDIQLVIMDIRMPEVDGLEATRLIRKYRPNLPILIYTAINDPEYKFLSKKLNCAEFILKPLTPSEVILIMEKYLDSQPDTSMSGKYLWT